MIPEQHLTLEDDFRVNMGYSKKECAVNGLESGVLIRPLALGGRASSFGLWHMVVLGEG